MAAVDGAGCRRRAGGRALETPFGTFYSPNITPDAATGIGGWSEADLRTQFELGMLPDGDSVGGVMAEVVEHSTRHLKPEDIKAIWQYLRSLPAIHNDLPQAP